MDYLYYDLIIYIGETLICLHLLKSAQIRTLVMHHPIKITFKNMLKEVVLKDIWNFM